MVYQCFSLVLLYRVGITPAKNVLTHVQSMNVTGSTEQISVDLLDNVILLSDGNKTLHYLGQDHVMPNTVFG